jgi:hypothetical protein
MSRLMDKQSVLTKNADAAAVRCREWLVVTLQSSASGSATSSRLVRVERTAGGTWDVSDECGKRGGRFRDYRSAKVFIRREFAASQPTIIKKTGEGKA